MLRHGYRYRDVAKKAQAPKIATASLQHNFASPPISVLFAPQSWGRLPRRRFEAA
jgi:hypothetical protein